MGKYKVFCRYAEKIKAEMEKLYNNGIKMNVITYIIDDINNGRYKLAFNTIISESDKIKNTKYGDIFRKYKIYESFNDIYKRRIYNNRYRFKGTLKMGNISLLLIQQIFVLCIM